MHFNKLILIILMPVKLLAFTGKTTFFNTNPSHPNKDSVFLLGTQGFEENKGQLSGEDAGQVKFFYKTKGFTVFLMHNGISYQHTKSDYPEGYFDTSTNRSKKFALAEKIKTETYRMDVILTDSKLNPSITAEKKNSDYTNYYNKNVMEVSNYGKVIYHDVYPNIDWVIYINEGNLKYDFIVHPGGDPHKIVLTTKWVENQILNADGSLTLQNRLGTIVEQKPVSFSGEHEIPSSFVIQNNTIKFRIGEYNLKKELVIDPSLTWSTYYGTSNSDGANTNAVDALGNIYIGGETFGGLGVASGGYQLFYGGGPSDAFLVKFNSAGNRIWSTYYGGNIQDGILDCVIDYSNNVYVSGFTSSQSNIALSGHQTIYGGGSSDAFLVKFNSSGVRQWATFYGGSGSETGYSCDVDNSNNVFLIGITSSASNIAYNGFQNTYSSGVTNNGFIVKFNAAGVRQWGTYYAGQISKGATDVWGNIYITGQVNIQQSIAYNGHQNTYGGGTTDAFLTKFDNQGALKWATYYGGTAAEGATDCDIDLSGNVFIVGSTDSPNNISFNGFQDTLYNISNDCFLVKFDSTGLRQWGGYFGGEAPEVPRCCHVDMYGNIYLGGYTFSALNIAHNGFQNNYQYYDGLIAKFNPNGLRLWSSYFGGNSSQFFSIASSNTGIIYACGNTSSPDDVSFSGYQMNYGGNGDAFLFKIGDVCSSPAPPTGPSEIGFCHPASISNLPVNGSNLLYYTAAIGGIPLNAGTALEDGQTYYVSQTLNSCESTSRLAVQITINTPPNAPTGSSNQFFCHYGIISDMEITGSNIQWFTDSLMTFPIDSMTQLTDGMTYYAIQTVNGCSGQDALEVHVLLTISPPTGDSIQSLCKGATTNDLLPNGVNIQWHSDSLMNQVLASNTPLIHGNTYYASQQVNGCSSLEPLSVIIEITDILTTVTNNNGLTLIADQSNADYLWLNCLDSLTPIPNSTNQSFNVPNNGIYAVLITLNGCSDTSECVDLSDLGLNEYSSIDYLIYPNPATTWLHIELKEKLNIQVYSITGQLIMDYPDKLIHQINVSTLAPGLYLIRSAEKTLTHFLKE